MSYLIFDSEEEAKERSRQDWEAELGRPKNPEDVTEFASSWLVGLDGRTALEITGGGMRGTEEAIDVLPEDNWPKNTLPGSDGQ